MTELPTTCAQSSQRGGGVLAVVRRPKRRGRRFHIHSPSRRQTSPNRFDSLGFGLISHESDLSFHRFQTGSPSRSPLADYALHHRLIPLFAFLAPLRGHSSTFQYGFIRFDSLGFTRIDPDPAFHFTHPQQALLAAPHLPSHARSNHQLIPFCVPCASLRPFLQPPI
jgi:hypothetical protein